MSTTRLADDFALFRAIPRRSGLPNRALFLDLDGTLWPDTGVGSILKVNTLKISERVALKRLAKDWIRIGVSNQTLFGYQEKFNLTKYRIYRFKLFLLLLTGVVDAIYICHHHPKSKLSELQKDCENRKPKPGLLLKSQRDFNFNLSESVFVGDRVTDMIAAEAAGVHRRYLISGDRSFELNISDEKLSKSYSFRSGSSLVSILRKLQDDAR